MHRYRPRAILGDEGARRVVSVVAGIRLGGDSQIDYCLAKGQFALRRTEAFVGGCRIVGHLHGARIGKADVLPGHADDAPRQIARVGAAVEHAGQPVEGAIRAGAAYRLVQRRYLVVERVTTLVETAQVLRHRFFDELAVNRNDARRMCRGTHLLEQVEQAACIAIRQSDQPFTGIRGEAQIRQRPFAGTVKQGAHLRLIERLQHIDRSTREQGGIDLERRIFGRRADEGQQARFDEGQEAVLLRLIEAVDFVDEENRPPPLPAPHFGLGYRLAHFLDPEKTADNAMNSHWNCVAIIRASVVLPTPGGPQRIIECGCPDAKARRKGLPGPSRCC